MTMTDGVEAVADNKPFPGTEFFGNVINLAYVVDFFGRLTLARFDVFEIFREIGNIVLYGRDISRECRIHKEKHFRFFIYNTGKTLFL